MDPLIGGLISGGSAILGGLLQGKPKTNKAMNSSIRKSNRQAVKKANEQEVAWNKQVQKKAEAAAKVPIVTTTKYGSKETDRTVYNVSETTSYGRRDDVRSYVDVDAMMAAANKSGFNPVTFLNAGGLQAYTRTVSQASGKDVYRKTGGEAHTLTRSGSDVETVTGSNAMQAALVGLDKPAFNYYEGAVDYSTPSTGMTTGQAIGQGLNAGVNTYLSQRQQLDQNEFQQGLLTQQLVAANQRGNGRGYSQSGVPSMVSSYNVTNTRGGSSGSGAGGGMNYKGIPLTTPQAGWADYEAIKKQNETLAGFAEMLDAVEVSAGGPGRGGFWDPKSTPQIRQYMWDLTGGDYWDDRARKLYESGPFSGGTPYRPYGGAPKVYTPTFTPARGRNTGQ